MARAADFQPVETFLVEAESLFIGVQYVQYLTRFCLSFLAFPLFIASRIARLFISANLCESLTRGSRF